MNALAPDGMTWSRELVLRLATVSVLIFSQSIPITFIQNALPAIYRSKGLELEDFWLFALLFVPRWIKWLIGPLADRYTLLPIGLRRSWILIFTFLGSLGYLSLVLVEPTLSNIYIVVGMLVFAEFIMAIQDVGVDSYAVEMVRGEESRVAGPIFGIASTLGFAVASGVVMVLYDTYGWSTAIATLSVLLVVGTLPALIRPEPISTEARRRIHKQHGLPNFKRAFTRENAMYLFLLVMMAALYQGFGFTLTNALLIDKNFTVGEIGIAFGTGVSLGLLVGTAVSAWLMAKFTLKTVCLIALVGIVIATGLEVSLAVLDDYSLLYIIICVAVFEFVLSPHWSLMSSARLRWTSKRQAGTDFTLQSSLRALGLFLGGVAAGPFGGAFGYVAYFFVSHLIGVLATITMFWIHDRMERTVKAEMAEDEI